MNVKQWKLRQWVILCVVLLVLVGSLLAYFVFIPKVFWVESLQKQLSTAQAQQANLLSTPKPSTVTDAQKNALALLVPAQLEQERFLQELHAGAAASGVNVVSIAFLDSKSSGLAGAQAPNASAGSNAKPSVKTNAKPGSAALPMQTFSGKLSLTGDYKQVRTFLEKFSTMSRLVTYNAWTLKAEKQDITPTSTGTGNTTVPAAGTSGVSGSSATFSAVTTGTGSTANTVSTVQRLQNQLAVANLTPAEIRKHLTPEFLNDKLLNDLTPIFTQTDFNRYQETIRATVPTLTTQHEKDVANLRIQQGFNRYSAGTAGKKQADSVFDQEFAQVFIPGTNANIREVLGLISSTADAQTSDVQGGQNETPQPPANIPPPLILVNQPDYTIQSNHVFKTVVTLDIDFTLYFAPNAIDVLPAPGPMKTYDPTWRTNPVESR
ncbi:hypothetical protein [Tumebacillus flagellatus]|uniref:Uncharacterized protein n=1 Tax=Tumebacillus flagellatus TaxID=1157490 RepID=A0A074LQD1_9BACL|nr:hypothetical protein [Tumebacillus flagellatus]KEO82690.1 hypothetical protein EL26_14080 [Tumebacillus flagellatus]